jgi:hypothetical protein
MGDLVVDLWPADKLPARPPRAYLRSAPLEGERLSGEPGIGKGRLLQVLPRQLAGDPYARAECRCSPFSQHTAAQGPPRGRPPLETHPSPGSPRACAGLTAAQAAPP